VIVASIWQRGGASKQVGWKGGWGMRQQYLSDSSCGCKSVIICATDQPEPRQLTSSCCFARHELAEDSVLLCGFRQRACDQPVTFANSHFSHFSQQILWQTISLTAQLAIIKTISLLAENSEARRLALRNPALSHLPYAAELAADLVETTVVSASTISAMLQVLNVPDSASRAGACTLHAGSRC